MPRKSTAKTITVSTNRSKANFRRRVVTVMGRPGTPTVQQTFPIVRPPSYTKAKVNIVLKRDVSKGLSMPEADRWAIRSGVITSDSGGYKGVTIVRQKPLVPPKQHSSRTVAQRAIPAPSPTQGAGVRDPRNPTKRAAGSRTAKNTRYR